MNEPIKLIVPEPNQSLIELLEGLLEDAKEGRIVALCGVSKNTGGEFAEFFTHNTFDHVIPFLAYLRVLQMRLESEVEMD